MKTTLTMTQKTLAALTLLVALINGATNARATLYEAVKTGNWNNTTFWSPNGTPGASDTATISNSVTISVNAAITAPALTIVTNTGVLQLTSGSATLGN